MAAPGDKLSTCVLLGDIGATNARFALVHNKSLGTVTTLEVAKFPNFADALRIYCEKIAQTPIIRHAMFAVAGPVKNGRANLTNAPWTIDRIKIEEEFGFSTRVVNDFEALAHSVRSFTQKDIASIGEVHGEVRGPMAILGPGSGLGVACLFANQGDVPVAIASEGGHLTLAGTSDREDRIIRCLRSRFAHVSVERVVSGPGLENLFSAIATVDAVDARPLGAAEITSNALSGQCNLCREALGAFCAFLGSFAGNMALTFGATGGVYVAGGISPRIVEFMRRSEFRHRFEAKGRFQPYLQSIPSSIIIHPSAAFLGLIAMGRKASVRAPSASSCHSSLMRDMASDSSQ